MKSTFDTKADSNKQDKIKAVLSSNEGVFRRPIRKRGFHRALKRKELWALIENSCRHLIDAIAYEMFGHN